MGTNNLPPELLNTVHCMDCLEFLKTLPDNSIDSVVTDPPYGLSFMGKKWDYDVPSIEIRQECLRVLKPGGYLLAFAGTRTQHRMAVRIEDAGFEIRDMIAWVYGSGFPKSLNIGKAVDKIQGNERVGVGENPNFRPISGKEGYLGQSNFRQTDGMSTLTKGNSEWEGWGTALKPALEPITVARKPLSEKTVAENCLKWGVGGINIDGCRVGTEDNLNGGAFAKNGTERNDGRGMQRGGAGNYEQPLGRFPANLIHSGEDEVVSLFPNTKSGKMKQHIEGGEFNVFGKQYPRDVETIGDSGSASRFFYCAKASKSERNRGLEGFEEKQRYGTKNAGELNQFSGKYGTEERKKKNPHNPQSNHHPTVKPVSLMQYLVRLVTRKGGIVLDPFTGSGTTGIACKLEGMNFVGIEREQEYVDIAKARIDAREEEKVIDIQPSLFDN